LTNGGFEEREAGWTIPVGARAFATYEAIEGTNALRVPPGTVSRAVTLPAGNSPILWSLFVSANPIRVKAEV